LDSRAIVLLIRKQEVLEEESKVMSLLSLDELKTLVEQPKGLCVSIYMPISQGAEIPQNPIRFKNLMRQAEELLEDNGSSNKEAQELLQPAQEEVSTENCWQQQNEGLAIFIAAKFYQSYAVPLNLAELVVVTDHFHLKPLLPLLTSDKRFYVLALSQQDVRLIECTLSNVREIELEDVPKSLEETLRYDETAKEGQRRMSTPKGGTSNSFQQAGSFHGQGSPDRDKFQEDILQFFHAID
jgi:hypothetical protein